MAPFAVTMALFVVVLLAQVVMLWTLRTIEHDLASLGAYLAAKAPGAAP